MAMTWLELARRNTGTSVADAAKEIGRSRQAFHRYELEPDRITVGQLAMLCRHKKVDADTVIKALTTSFFN